jgi:hypothetical protein
MLLQRNKRCIVDIEGQSFDLEGAIKMSYGIHTRERSADAGMLYAMFHHAVLQPSEVDMDGAKGGHDILAHPQVRGFNGHAAS